MKNIVYSREFKYDSCVLNFHINYWFRLNEIINNWIKYL